VKYDHLKHLHPLIDCTFKTKKYLRYLESRYRAPFKAQDLLHKTPLQ